MNMNCRLAFLFSILVCFANHAAAQTDIPWTLKRLPDTGQTSDITQVFGEDSDFVIQPPSYTDNGDGTVTDNVTGLMWQQQDGGEMTWEDSQSYSGALALAGYEDWRLPTYIELFSIQYHQQLNPALDTDSFPASGAEYWWSSTISAEDPNRIWVTNAGGGIGDHPRDETISAGGAKPFHVRCVRMIDPENEVARSLQANGDGTVIDENTGLVWQQEAAEATTWEGALAYSEGLELASASDWRLPNIKELQSITDAHYVNPSIDASVFTDALTGSFWSSTSLINRPEDAWIIQFDRGIVTHESKTSQCYVRCVRGETEPSGVNEWPLH
ncbi:DUF1566 domain-containing protein [bacterium]|nr:DUF1566 domain-containing protein [bacterium]